MRLDRGDAGIPHLRRADLVRGIAKHERAHQIGSALVERLGNEAADGEAADDRPLHREPIEQAGEIGRMILDRIGNLADLRKAVAAFVVKDDRKIGGQPHDDVAPDAKVRAERIDEDEHRLCRGGADQPIVDRDVVDTGELHG